MAKDGLRFLGDPANPVNCTCDILDKEASGYMYVQYMLDRTNSMFRYSGLPDTIPAYMLEYMLQVYGSVAVIKHEDNLYVMRANFSGPPDPYYRPTQAVIANPALALAYTYRIDNYLPPFDRRVWDSYDPCIRFHNDTQLQGLIPLFSRYAVQMVENDISIRSAQINLRQQTIIVADTGPEVESATRYIENLINGKLSAIGKRSFLDGVTVAEGSKGQQNTVMQLIELQQYLKASWYNDIGLNSNFNMKSQYISSEEINSSADIMLPLIDNMYKCRQIAVDQINSLFGTEITVEKNSAWEKKQIQSDLSILTDDDSSPLTNELLDSLVDETLSEEVSDDIDSSDEIPDDTGDIVVDTSIDDEPDISDDESDSSVNETEEEEDDKEPVSDEQSEEKGDEQSEEKGDEPETIIEQLEEASEIIEEVLETLDGDKEGEEEDERTDTETQDDV